MSAELRTVLYVEDDPDIQEVAKVALEIVGGLEVTIARSGAEAIEMVTQNAPDLVLLDVMMPVMDGPSTLRALQAIDGLTDLPVIFVTAKVQASEVEAYSGLGAIGIISKPFDPMTLADEARRLWNAAKDRSPQDG